jgi:hypothetical protein
MWWLTVFLSGIVFLSGLSIILSLGVIYNSIITLRDIKRIETGSRKAIEKARQKIK